MDVKPSGEISQQSALATETPKELETKGERQKNAATNNREIARGDSGRSAIQKWAE